MGGEAKMPRTVRIALGWFVLLAIASCAPLACMLAGWWCREERELGLLLAGLLPCGGLIALGAGFVLAILRGRRKWVTIPYLLAGFLILCLLLADSPPKTLMPGMAACRIAVAAATILPLVLLHLPSATRWFAAFPRRKGLGAGCCTLVVLAIAGMMASVVTVSPMPKDSAWTSAQAMRGRYVFCLLVQNKQEREAGAQGVDVAACANSLELVERLCTCYESSTNLAASGGQWSIAVNLPPDVPDTFPLMITANVDPAQLPREWDGVTGKDKRLEPRPLEGVGPLKFGNRAIVVIRKGGAAQVIKRKYVTLGTLFGDRPYRLGKDTYFLTPVGKR